MDPAPSVLVERKAHRIDNRVVSTNVDIETGRKASLDVAERTPQHDVFKVLRVGDQHLLGTASVRQILATKTVRQAPYSDASAGAGRSAARLCLEAFPGSAGRLGGERGIRVTTVPESLKASRLDLCDRHRHRLRQQGFP